MFKKFRKSRVTFLLLSITAFIILYNLYRKNYEKEFGQSLVKLEPLKKGELGNDKNPDEKIVSHEEGGETEDDDFQREFGVDGDIKAAVDNLGNNKKIPVNAGHPASDVDNGGEFYN
uniref:Uncharacterized protein n=1 Tax=Panagrolaimus superbus TaxID=310955 RepID=A0A914Y1Y0_9BILA